MFLLYAFLGVAVSLIVMTIMQLRHDGRGPQRPPLSHFDDPMFHSPAAR